LYIEYEGEDLDKIKVEIYNSNGVNIFKIESRISNPQYISKILVPDWTPRVYLYWFITMKNLLALRSLLCYDI